MVKWVLGHQDIYGNKISDKAAGEVHLSVRQNDSTSLLVLRRAIRKQTTLTGREDWNAMYHR